MRERTETMIRPATPADVPLIRRLIFELAEYERLSHTVTLDESRLQEHLFGARPCIEALIAEADGEPAGFALFFHNYSTFQCQPGLYLEDLFVRPQFRGRGLGRALFLAVAKLAVQRECGRMEWTVLNWNAPAIQFYESLGAGALDDWTKYRLTDAALQSVAAMD
jgi:GNAT superfamily N-acetyltransferase